MSSSLIPPWADPFLAREQVLADMAARVEQCRARNVASLLYIHGLEGLGVSCTATQFSKKYRDLVGGRLVWLNGRRPDGRPIPLGELLTRAARQLGVSAADQGATEAEQADVYRAGCKHKRFMLVLDDMAVLSQATGLIPDDAPEAIIVVTTAFERPRLEASGFKAFTPDFLPPESARVLFHSVLRDSAQALTPKTRDALVELCGGIPLMVKVVAAQTRGRAVRADRLLSQLLDLKLNLLALDDEQRITGFLDTAYGSLTGEESRAYRWLGWLPATDFSIASAAAALDIDPDDTLTILEKLTEFHLLTMTPTERYAFHPVLRHDARARAREEDAGTTLDEVAKRWIEWNLRETFPRAAAVSNRWWVAPVHDLMAQHYGPTPPVVSRAEALDWFAIEETNLIAAVEIAPGIALHTEAWVVCVLFWKYLHIHGLHDAWLETHSIGLASARTAGSDLGVMQLSLQLGAVYLDIGQYAEANDHFAEALSIARTQDHGLGRQSALEWLAKTAARQGQTDVALDFFHRSREVTETDARIPLPDKERVFALLELQSSRTLADANRWDGLVDRARTVLAYFDRFDNETDNRAKIRLVQGRALLTQGDAEAAEAVFRDAAALFAGENARRHQGDAEYLRAQALRAAHRHSDAMSALRTALDLYRSVGSPQTATVAEELARIEGR